MYLFEIWNTEDNPHYQSLAISNGERQFSFLQSVSTAAIASQQACISQGLLEALNFHAIACLHRHSGIYRPIPVHVRDGNGAVVFNPVAPEGVAAMMDGFITETNAFWVSADPLLLAAFVVWRLCNIHPFVNGNGRTARAAGYYVLCVKMGGLLPGQEFLPTLLKESPEYRPALVAADLSATAGTLDLSVLRALLEKLLLRQLSTATEPAEVVTA